MQKRSEPKISIVIPVRNEERYIRRCLDSILESSFPSERMEILLVDGMSTDRTRGIVEGYRRRHPFIRLLDNPKKIVPVAMNIGIARARGEYIVRLDAHAEYPKDYLEKLLYWHEKLEADNVGGVIRTEVKHPTPTSNAIRNVLGDRFGVGSAFRSGVERIEEVDTVPFGCYRREVFDKIGLYDERLVRNQDIELNKRLKRAGGRILLVPDIESVYYARETFVELAKNSFANGRWNILTAYYTGTPKSLSLRHFVPLLFLLSWSLPLLLAPLFPPLAGVALFSLLAYTLLVVFRSTLIGRGTTLFHQVAAFFVLHFSYGLGELAGIIEVLKLSIRKRGNDA